MKKKREYQDYLNDIIIAIEDAINFTKIMTYDDFQNDKKTVLAIEKCIEIIGEATKNIPNSIRGKYPEIPWKDMAGMRDRLSHVYHDVDIELVWEVIQQELPQLKITISKIIAELKD